MARRLLILFLMLGGLVITGGSLWWLLPIRPVEVVDNRVAAAIPARPIDLVWHQTAPVPWAARDSHTAFVFQNKLWILGGLAVDSGGQPVSMEQYAKAKYYNDIWFSSDGFNWQEATSSAAFPPLRSASVTEYHGALYLTGGWSPVSGYQIGIWKSVDGLTWESVAKTAPFGAREGQKVIVWNDDLWLSGGVNYEQAKVFNDIWSSGDGLNWEKKISSNPLRPENPWAPRWDHDVAVFQNKLWLAGGMALGNVGYGDVWSTVDGQNWEREAEITPWGRRQGHVLDVFQNKLWLVGGLGIKINNDVHGNTWFSVDGQTWQELPASESGATWLPREDHSALVFQNKLWFFGGMDENWDWTNEVWYLE